MATSIRPDHSDGGATPDPQQVFIDQMAAKYEKEDAATAGADEDEDDGASADEAEAGRDDAGSDDDSTDEDPDAGTSSDDSDGSADESEDGSSSDDETDHTTDDESEESEESGTADDDGTDDEAGTDDEDEDPASDATKAALAARGADLKLEDIPSEYQGIVKSKLKSIDAAFTRVQQDATAFRAERTQFEADKRFRDENPEFALTEAIQAALAKDPEIFDKINARFEKLEDPDHKAAFDIVLKNKRAETVKAVETEHGRIEQLYARADVVEKTAQALATKAGLPWRLAERAVEAALLRKPETARDLTDEELQAVIAAEAAEYTKETRSQRREASKDLVKNRTANRSVSAPPARRPAAAAPPRPAGKKKPEVDYNSEESRQRAIMGTLRRVAPGAKDE